MGLSWWVEFIGSFFQFFSIRAFWKIARADPSFLLKIPAEPRLGSITNRYPLPVKLCNWNFGCGHIFAMCEAVKSFRSIGETWFFRFSKGSPFEFFLFLIVNSSIINSKGPLKIWKIKYLQSIWNFSQLHIWQKYDHSQTFSCIASLEPI